MTLSKPTFTEPTIVASDDLSKRSYVTFYFNNQRVREYSGSSILLKIQPNRAKSIAERDQLLSTLKFELHKALDANNYPTRIEESKSIVATRQSESTPTVIRLLFEAVKGKLRSDLSRTYKRDLKDIYRKFRDFMLPEEAVGELSAIKRVRVEKFLSQFGSTGTYYMNKRRNLSVLFTAAGSLIDLQVKQVKETQKRKAKATLHEKYEQEQLKPILNWLKEHYPNLYLCCLLTYGSWLRPHEEIRLLTKNDFRNANTEIHLSGDDNKGGKVRIVHVPEYIRVELQDRLSAIKRDDNIFSLDTVPFNEYYFNTQWSRAWAKMYKLGLIFEDQTIYSFRHTAAVQLYRRTKDVHLLQQLLGHSAITVTLKYLRNLGEIDSEQLAKYAPQLE